MWRVVRNEARTVGREAVERNVERRHGVTASHEMIQDMLHRRRAITQRQTTARVLRRCLPIDITNSIIECFACFTAFLTCAIFAVCILLMAHLNNIEDVVTDVVIRSITIIIFVLWLVCIGCYGFVIWFDECLLELETDPDDLPHVVI